MPTITDASQGVTSQELAQQQHSPPEADYCVLVFSDGGGLWAVVQRCDPAERFRMAAEWVVDTDDLHPQRPWALAFWAGGKLIVVGNSETIKGTLKNNLAEWLASGEELLQL